VIAPLRAAMARRQGIQALEAALRSGFPQETPALERLIKRDSKGMVAEARWQGEPVIVKQFASADAAQRIARMEADHALLRALFPHEGLDFANILAAATAQGIVLLPVMPGIRLDTAMIAASPAERVALVTKAGQWLARSLDGQRGTGHFSPNHWRRMLEAQLGASRLPLEDRRLLDTTLVRLAAMAPALRGGPVPRGPIHRDFSPQNMHWDCTSGSLGVFDLDYRTEQAIAMALVRLLSELTQRLWPHAPGMALDQGLCPDLRTALLAVPVLEHDGPDAQYLTYLTGARLGALVIEKQDSARISAARACLANWLETAPCP